MSKRAEHRVNVGGGYTLSYRTVAIMRRLRVSLEDARAEFGDQDLNKMLLAVMEPEAGR